MAAFEYHQVGQPGHFAVLPGDFADDSGRGQPGQAGQIDGGLGMSRPLQHPPGPRRNREYMPRNAELLPCAPGID